MLQIRDIPDDFIKRGLERAAKRPSMREWLESTRQVKPVSSNLTTAR